MSVMVTNPIISTRGLGQNFFALPQDTRDDFTAWLSAAGAGVEDLADVEYHVADEPLLRLTRYVRDAEGRLLVTLDGDKKPVPLSETAEIRCLINLPTWWVPLCVVCGGSKLRVTETGVHCRSCYHETALPV